MLLPLWCNFLLLTEVLADYLIAPRVINSVNYDDFSLLCADGIPLLMEDHRTRPCQPRPWLRKQKCPTGFWCHEGEEESSYYCCPRNRKTANRCHLPPAAGHGKKAMRRFYYDWTNDGCHELTYSGLGGNENSFITYEECENACRGTGEPNIMLSENANLFKNKKTTKEPTHITSRAAKSTTTEASVTIISKRKNLTIGVGSETIIQQTVTTAPSAARTTARQNTTTTAATVSTTKNPETTSLEVTTAEHGAHLPSTRWTGTNPCEQHPDKGNPGGVAQKMWHFDESTLSCQSFIYFGSGGNANRFADQIQCFRVCGSGRPSLASCNLEPQFGNGTYKIPRYYFDKITKQCELFFYSGEGGNENRFLRKRKCERLCLKNYNKKNISPFVITTIGTRAVTRAFQDLHSTRELPGPVTTTPAKSKLSHELELLTPRQPDGPLSAKTTIAEPFPTLVNVPKEFIPPFPQFTLLPRKGASSTPETKNHPQRTTTPFRSTESKYKSIDPIFEQPIASPRPPFVTARPTPFSLPEEVPEFLTRVVVPSHRKPNVNGESSGWVPGFEGAPATPNRPHGQWRTRFPDDEAYNPLLSVPSVTETIVVDSSPSLSGSGTERSQSSFPSEGLAQIQKMVYTSNPDVILVDAQIEFPPIEHLAEAHINVNIDNFELPRSSHHVQLQKQMLSHNPKWVGNGMRTFQSVMQQQQTPTVSSFEIDFVTSTESTSNSVATFSSSKDSTVETQEAQEPQFAIAPVSPEGDLESATQLTSVSYEKISAQVDNASPCLIPTYDEVVIMCVLTNVTCPMGTFCQVGDGQSVCCPQLPEAVCDQPVKPGVGPSALLRWYFDRATKRCIPFSFHGFQGNQNNFESLTSCEYACELPQLCERGSPAPSTSANESCSLFFPLSCPKGYFCKIIGDSGVSACCPEPEYQLKKVSSHPERLTKSCFMEQDPGYGMHVTHRWSFDPSSSICVSFIYNGYGGNQNNFLSRNDCESACKSASSCNLPVESGHGREFISRFFYSKEYGQCLHFIYSGEGGNSNNFPNLHECLNTCMVFILQLYSHLVKNEPTFAFAFISRPICPHGDVATINGIPITCEATKDTGCPTGNVCTPMEMGSFCCQAPESFCLQSRPTFRVCLPSSFSTYQVYFTYDPLADRCVQFSFTSCRPSINLNHFASRSKCSKLCCNQGYDLVYKKRLLLMNDSPLESPKQLQDN